MGLTLTCSWRNLMYSMASESTEAVSVWHNITWFLRSIKVKDVIVWIQNSERKWSLSLLIEKVKELDQFRSLTFPKGDTNCWSAVILSPIFSFLTYYQSYNNSHPYLWNWIKFKKKTRKRKKSLKLALVQSLIYCTLKAGKGVCVSFRGLLDVASLPLFFTTVLESRTSDIFC